MSTPMDDASLAALLERLHERLDRLEGKVDALHGTAQGVIDRLGVVADGMASTAQVAADATLAPGVDPIDLLIAAGPVARKATRPENLELLGRLLDRGDDVRFLLDVADALDRSLKDAGLDRRVVAERGVELAVRFAAISAAPEINALVRVGERDALQVASQAGEALAEARRDPIEPVGFFGMLRAMGDPAIGRAMGFAFAFARRFGERLR